MSHRGIETAKRLNAGSTDTESLLLVSKKSQKQTNAKAKPLVVILCFSDDIWWTKAKEMKAFCLHSAEP